MVIDSLLHHMTDPEIATTGIACLFYMSKPDSNAHVAPTKTVMRRIVRVVITALETHLYDSNVSSRIIMQCFNVSYIHVYVYIALCEEN